MTGGRRVVRPAGPPVAAPKPAPPAHRRTTVNEKHHPSVVQTSGDLSASPKPKRRRGGRGVGPLLPERTIVFVGPMAAGKTSLGRRVAKELAIPFIDSDVLFVQDHGAITEFFAAHGEEEFRRIEAEIIARELSRPGIRVLALGGGAVLTESTRKLLENHPTILLMTTQDAVLRTANLARRPLLRDDPSAWNRILAERKPLYHEVADITFRTDRAGKEQLTQRVVLWVRSYARKERTNARRSASPPKAEQTDATKSLTTPTNDNELE